MNVKPVATGPAGCIFMKPEAMGPQPPGPSSKKTLLVESFKESLGRINYKKDRSSP